MLEPILHVPFVSACVDISFFCRFQPAPHSVEILITPAMASSQIPVRTPMEALQKSLEDEKVAHRQCQRRLEMMQRKNEALEQRLAEEARSHQYFKSRLAKAKNAAPRFDSDAMLAEIAALTEDRSIKNEVAFSKPKGPPGRRGKRRLMKKR